MPKTKPIFNKRIFWDVDFENIDYDLHINWIIERVFDRGDVEDIRNCRKYYGDEKIKEILLNAKYISERRLYLASVIINQSIENFRCHKLKQLNPTLYPY